MKIAKEIKGKRMALWKDAELADNPFNQIRGIMFRKKVARPLLFIFKHEQAISIHSYFCIPFDIIYLDKFGKIIESRSNVGPNKILPKIKCKYIIECRAGEIEKKELRKGDALYF
jgi:uncharacterized membrane protein (UPF0127 family)